MNQIINKFLLARDKFIPEMHLKQPGFTYSACGPFTKHKQRIQKFMQTGDTNYSTRMILIKVVLLMMQHILIVKILLKEHQLIKS